ncbi:MAG: DNA alkylation repair protein [Bacillota bacterium]
MAEAGRTTYEDILEKLQVLADPAAVEGMAKYGITPVITFGVSIPNLRRIAKETGRDHDLARRLWAADIRETRILASMIDDPKLVTEEQGLLGNMRPVLHEPL